MIGKHIPSPKKHSSFKGLNDYITGKSKRRLEEQGEKIAYSDCINLASVETATVEMESLAFQNKRCKDPVMHLLLSWRENETPTEGQVREAVKITLDEMNLSQCQTLYSLHQNTDNLHLHICVNRIDPDTHKAVTPAGGWTRRAMERAARKIEAAQGWQTEENTWSEVNEQGEAIQKLIRAGNKIPQQVKDVENLTGEQSAIRKAQEALSNVLEKVSDWGEFHAATQQNGIEYRKKGSGAILQVGDITIKASSVSRNFALNKLEKHFGAYQPPNVQIDEAEKTKINSPAQLVENEYENVLWPRYMTAKTEHDRNRRLLTNPLSVRQKNERQDLKNHHRKERSELYKSLGGKGFTRRHINMQSSILAARHGAETARMKKQHKAEREKLMQTSEIFMSYESWLRGKGFHDFADNWRHRNNKNFRELHPPKEFLMQKQEEKTINPGILGFRMEATSQGLRFYKDEAGTNQASFTDMGKKIRLYKEDDESLLAALQLAQEKWGGVQLNGTDEYKRRCVEIATQNGIRIANLELKEITGAVKAETLEERALRMKEIFKTLHVKSMELARKHFPEGMIIITDAQEGKKYPGTIIGIVSHEGETRALQVSSGCHVIRRRVPQEEKHLWEGYIGHNVDVSDSRHRIEREQLEKSRRWSR